jgi:heme-degrading monooxygenase HmoA
MIARVWHGYTSPDNADAYRSMLQPELLPGLSTKRGFRGSYLLRRPHGDEVEFITIILWDSLEDIRAITGANYQAAVIPNERKRVLARWDATAAHYDVSATQASPTSFL